MVGVRRQPQWQWTHAQLFFLFEILAFVRHASAEFDPYQLNGGLVAAVAGRNYCLVAVDTRLVGPSGYDLLERRHLQSRLWTATVPSPATTTTTTARTTPRSVFQGDGSLCFPPLAEQQQGNPNCQDDNYSQRNDNAQLQDTGRGWWSTTSQYNASPILIASAGCQADCEFLKRRMRFDVRQSLLSGELTTTPTTVDNQHDHPITAASGSTCLVGNIAVLLSHILYERRGFPWYAFCIVAGLEAASPSFGSSSDRQEHHEGQVHVYDALGSYEQVAVASAGIGQQLLQPILDRAFSSRQGQEEQQTTTQSGVVDKDDTVVLSQTGCPLVVDQSAQEAAEILIQAFRAVSERQTTVGDFVVLCCMERRPGSDTTQVSTRAVPLKRH